MKPQSNALTIVTATMNQDRAKPCFESWEQRAAFQYPTICVVNGALDTTGMEEEQAAFYQHLSPVVDWKHEGVTVLVRPEILGVVPAFALGVAQALKQGAEIICCFHDDLRIEQDSWDLTVLEEFDRHPEMGLAGFGGGKGLGTDDIYQAPYDPMQLARQDFISNMSDAEAHGRRVIYSERAACFDGFCQIGRRQFWYGDSNKFNAPSAGRTPGWPNLFNRMADAGLVHHAYDSALGAYAARLGWEARLIPVRCTHLGGQTAVGEPRYSDWAQQQIPGGDHGFWEQSHKVVYQEFRDVLPIRT